MRCVLLKQQLPFEKKVVDVFGSVIYTVFYTLTHTHTHPQKSAAADNEPSNDFRG